MPSVGTAFLSA